MAHEHNVYDNDKHFRIDPATRQIKNNSNKVVLIQHDHDSERFTFEIPKTVEDHDMSKCNVVQIHYLNIEAASGTDNEGIYEVNDLQTKNIVNQQGEKEDVVVCSWLISRNATQYVGSLNFVVRFKCVEDDGTVSYEWATAIHKGIAVSDSIYNSEAIVAEYADVLEKWRSSLFFNTDGVTEDIAMGGYKIIDLGAPTDSSDAATKGYVDNAVKNIDLSGVDASDKVSKAGDIMAGQLDMNTNKIIGVGDPEDDADAANKGYVDEQVANIDVTEQLNELSAELTDKMNKIGWVKLWENASPDSSFSKQTIKLPTLAADFTILAIETNDRTFFVSTKVGDDAQAVGFNHVYSDGDYYFVSIGRPTWIYVENGTVSIEFEDACCVYAGSEEINVHNSYLKPRIIYGVYKGE